MGATATAVVTDPAASDDNNENEEEYIWYFAIGSMCNPTSITNRELTAIESFPAEVIDYRLEFFGPSGVAGAVPEKGKTFHGVLHKMTASDKNKLDVIELGYDAVPCRVKLYDGSIVDGALIYVLNHEKAKAWFKKEDDEKIKKERTNPRRNGT